MVELCGAVGRTIFLPHEYLLLNQLKAFLYPEPMKAFSCHTTLASLSKCLESLASPLSGNIRLIPAQLADRFIPALIVLLRWPQQQTDSFTISSTKSDRYPHSDILSLVSLASPSPVYALQRLKLGSHTPNRFTALLGPHRKRNFSSPKSAISC